MFDNTIATDRTTNLGIAEIRSTSSKEPRLSSISPAGRNFNPFYGSSINTNVELLECDEEVFVLNNSKLEIMMNEVEEDFCICRRCRSLSGPLGLLGATPPSNNRPHVRCRNCVARTHSGDGRELRDDHLIISGSINEDRDDIPFILHEDQSSDEMDHCHFQKPMSSGVLKARKQLIISSCLCVAFMLAEFIGGYLSSSLAIMTDAAHLLSDLASFLISLFALWVGQKAPTKRMSFGYYRAEILGAVASVLIIWVLTGILVYMAIERIRTADYEIQADTMIIVSGSGVAINILMGIVLHGGCMPSHGHSHSGLTSHAHSHSESSDNINVRAAFIHVIGDLIQSIGVLIAAYIIRYFPQYKIADPICTFLFSGLVLFTTIAIMRDALWVLMEGFPRNLDYSNIISQLKSIDGVKTAHSLHIWSLTTDKNALAVHLAIEPDADPHIVLSRAQFLLKSNFMIHQATIQVEKYMPEVMDLCKACQGPE